MSAGTKNPPRLLDQVRRRMRAQHMSLSTEKSYVSWIRRFILYHGKSHPKDMAEPEINAFLSHLAADRHVSASTQNQALSAILFLYRAVLEKELGDFGDLIRAKRPRANTLHHESGMSSTRKRSAINRAGPNSPTVV